MTYRLNWLSLSQKYQKWVLYFSYPPSAASLAVIAKMERESVIANLWSKGEKLWPGVEELIEKYNLEDVVQLAGKAPWSLVQYKAHKSDDRFRFCAKTNEL